MTYRYLVFDLDGTLIDSYRALTIAINRTGSDLLERELTEDEVKGIVGEGVERLLQKAFSIADTGAELIRRFEDEYERVCCEESRLLDDVAATIEALSESELVMGVCTNKPTRFSEQILDHLGLARHFAAVVGPDLAGCRKPDPRHLLHTLERIGGDRESALFIGDMPIDIAAARAAGVRVAAIATGSASERELKAHDPDIYLQRFSDIRSVVEATAKATD